MRVARNIRSFWLISVFLAHFPAFPVPHAVCNRQMTDASSVRRSRLEGVVHENGSGWVNESGSIACHDKSVENTHILGPNEQSIKIAVTLMSH